MTTGLQNNLNRWYDAEVGSWINEDPIGFEGGDANLYRYCGSDPVNAADPNGLATRLKDLMKGSGLVRPEAVELADDIMGAHDVAMAGISELDEGLAATIDGIIPGFDPFEWYYANPDGSVDSVYKWSRFFGAVSRDLLIVAYACPNLGEWLSYPMAPIHYEYGSMTVSKTLIDYMTKTLGLTTATARGRYMIQTYGWIGAFAQTAPGQFWTTIRFGLTPGASFLSILTGEAVDYFNDGW